MRGMKIALISTCFWLLFSSVQTTTIQAETVGNTLLTSAGLDTIIDHKGYTEVTISYVLEKKKELILKTDQDKMIDIDDLKSKLGSDNVKEDVEKKELFLTLDSSAIDFTMKVNNKTPFMLEVLKSDGEKIFDYQFNEPESYKMTMDDDNDPSEEATWTRTDNTRLSKGPVIEHTDGSMTQPYLYFGDYNEAIRPGATLEESWEQRGRSRKNSLTAPNTGILYAESGSRIEDGPKSVTNHVYTSHYGDNQSIDLSPDMSAIEDRSFGSPTSYTSNNMYNYVKKTDNSKKPAMAGPNKVGKSYAMVATPKLYYRIDPKTGFEEQRLVYKQRAFWERKKDRENQEITTTIKMSFTKTGKVITHFDFKNTGKVLFNNFIAFSNHDLSLNKDNQEIKNEQGKKIGNYIPMRALGGDRGMYFQAPNNEIRTSIYTNQENGPGMWAARSASRSYLATKGYLYNPGLLGLTPIRETYYPWKVGKGNGKTFFDKKNNIYRFPYTPSNTHNAFTDQIDLGDKDQHKGAGTRLGADKESVAQWDAGLTMRTKAVHLDVGKKVQLEYATMTDVPGTTFNPVFEFDNLGTNDNPQILPYETENLTLSGQWYDFDSKHVTLYYALDSENEEDMRPLFHDQQSDEDANNGRFHDFKSQIRIKGLKAGTHRIYLKGVDDDENESIEQEHVFNLIKEATKEPQIEVTSPNGTQKEPYSPLTNHFDLTGYWSDLDSKNIKSISYKIDDEDETIYQENINNPNLGKLVPWKLENLSIKKYNDFKVHTVEFKIVDDSGNEGTNQFYFRHIGGSIHLVAPEEIDFGQLTITSSIGQRIKPNMKEEKVLLEDFREQGSNPVELSLSIAPFYKAESNDHDDGDGDDSEANIDDNKKISKEHLFHEVYWNGKIANTANVMIGQTDGFKNDEWQQTTDFTIDILKKLKVSFRAGDEGVSLGKYVSHWTWQTVDSVS